MIRVAVLSPGFDSPNGAAFLFPLIKFSNTLRDFGVSLSIFNKVDALPSELDFLMVDGKYYKPKWATKEQEILDEIALLSKRTRLIWCDQTDSSGTLLGQVLPYVHKYAKAQLISDRSMYLETHYGARIYCDYYHRKYGVLDTEPFCSQPVVDPQNLSKLVVSWNSGLMHYGWLRPYLMVLYTKLNTAKFLQFSKNFTSPSHVRQLDFCCRMGIPYSRETVCFQRQRLKALLADQLPTDKLSRRAYLQEMRNSKLTISPFGYGEITLKDFECFLAGSALVKPDMSMFETWPNFYQKDVTYAAHSWDVDDVLEVIQGLLDHPKQALSIAEAGQNVYRRYTVSSEAPSLFAEQLLSLLVS
ncbi:glycosyltransferase [Thalassospira sp. MIT1370]|uniref:glycosyltransferase n=1 Tax=unclassified Thalassospira TaxID=2648997 RepID=UPI00399A780B